MTSVEKNKQLTLQNKKTLTKVGWATARRYRLFICSTKPHVSTPWCPMDSDRSIMVIWFDCGRRVLKMMWVLKNNAMNGVLTQSCRPNSWNSNIHKFIIHSALDEVFTLKHIVLLFKRNNHSFTIAYAHLWVCRLFGFRCDKSWTSAAMKLSYKLPDRSSLSQR